MDNSRKRKKSAPCGTKFEQHVGLGQLRTAMDARSKSSELKMTIFDQRGEMSKFAPDQNVRTGLDSLDSVLRNDR